MGASNVQRAIATVGLAVSLVLGCGQGIPDAGFQFHVESVTISGVDGNEEQLGGLTDVDLFDCQTENNNEVERIVNAGANAQLRIEALSEFRSGLRVRITGYRLDYTPLSEPNDGSGTVELDPVVETFDDGPQVSLPVESGRGSAASFGFEPAFMSIQKKQEFLDKGGTGAARQYRVEYTFFAKDQFGNNVSDKAVGSITLANFADEC